MWRVEVAASLQPPLWVTMIFGVPLRAAAGPFRGQNLILNAGKAAPEACSGAARSG